MPRFCMVTTWMCTKRAFLVASVPFFIWLGWFWRPLQLLLAVVAALSLLTIGLYRVDGAGQLARSETVFRPQVLSLQPVGHSGG